MQTKPFSELINDSKPVLVDFSAEWCGPCKMMAPVLKQVKESVGDTATILKIDVDKNRQLADAWKISGVPTLILFKEGKVLWRQSGVVSAQMLRNVIQQHSH
jgi:thioredoxin 1